jgi:hypothetical protein
MDRLEDAKALQSQGRHEGAFYICGYAVELGLKKKICKTLGWSGYPSTKNEFDKVKSFKTHDLDFLLHFSGVENEIKPKFWAEWSVVATWDPEIRYSSQKQKSKEVELMLKSAETLLKYL